MESIGRIGHTGYYEKIKAEDYYTRGAEGHGRWWGTGAKALGLSGPVQIEVLERVLEGLSPDGRSALTMNAVSPHRLRGLDLVLSATKGHSTIWSQADDQIRERLEVVFNASVDETLQYIEENAAFVRQGKGGMHVLHAGMVAAVYNHYSNRNLEPHAHAHMLLMNIGYANGKTNALVTPEIFAHKMDTGAIFRAELAARLERDLGLEVERTNDEFFEIKGVPKDLMTAFSSRRQSIQKALDERGYLSAKAAAIATLTTRPPKEEVTHEVLRSRWQAVGQSFGFSTAEVSEMIHSAPVLADRQHIGAEFEEAVRLRLRGLSEFTEKEVVRAIAVEAPGRGLYRSDVHGFAEAFLGSAEVERLSDSHGVHYKLIEPTTESIGLRHICLDEPEYDAELEWEPSDY